MERELQGRPTATKNEQPVKRIKRPVNLPLVDIYFIGAVGFHQTIAQPNI
jgi:hypothetical protein